MRKSAATTVQEKNGCKIHLVYGEIYLKQRPKKT